MTTLRNLLFAQVFTFRLASMLHVNYCDNYRNRDNFACNNRNMQYAISISYITIMNEGAGA